VTRYRSQPSTHRVALGAGWGVSDLRRRPAPVAAAAATTIPGFHARMTTDLVVGDGNDAQLRWDEWTNDDASVFADGTIIGGKLTDVIVKKKGWYAVHCWASWGTPGFAGDTGIMMIHDDFDVSEPALMQSQPIGFGFHLNETTTFQAVRYLPPLYEFTQTLPWYDRLEFWVAQSSSAARTVDTAYLDIAYLGVRTGD